jgi:cytochrome c oxidase subunit IV
MESNEPHITSYATYAKVLILLLSLTCISVSATRIALNEWTVIVALGIASMKVTLVLLFFMHLKYDQKILSSMVLGVFLLYIIIIVITFLDYFFR